MSIIAAVDRSKRAESVTRQARQLADDTGIELHVVYVGEVGVPNPKGGYDPDRDREMTEHRATGIAREIAQNAGLEEFEPVGLEGNPAEELLEYSREHDAEYIVVSARKQSPIGQAIFGSVTQSLLLDADCPVVATPHEPR